MPATAHAQTATDVSPPLPNVLLLLDSSGSMERMPNASLPTAVPGGATTTERNRWVQALEVLGGGISGYKLKAVDRASAEFTSEFQLSGTTPPYDKDYVLFHYRPYSNNCTVGAPSGAKTWAPLDNWGASVFGYHDLSGGSCTEGDVRTDGLGVLDTFRDQARFGLMTFDTDPRANTGFSPPSTVNVVDGQLGTWSYFKGWNRPSEANPTRGWPYQCEVLDLTAAASHDFEVGARNPYAPPWEGPLIRFAQQDTTLALGAVNDRIRKAIFAARPFGATPLGPMLSDAEFYLREDPDGPSNKTVDPYNECRGTFVVVVTDGFPNLDLRPSCERPGSPSQPDTNVFPNCQIGGGAATLGGCCPTKRAQDITYDLAHPTDATKQPIKTFVVGFALSDESNNKIDCSTVNPQVDCASMPSTDPKKPCCSLHEMAFNGGTQRAMLADDADGLRAQLVSAMSEVTAKNSTSRTLPVFVSASVNSTESLAEAAQAEFRSSFKVNPFTAWTGVLERVRWKCDSTAGGRVPVAQTFSEGEGDDYGANLNAQSTRTIVTWNVAGTTTAADDTIRPQMADTSDGIALSQGSWLSKDAAGFVGSIQASTLGLTSTSCGDTTDPELCKTKYLNYALALKQPRSSWRDRQGIALGDMYHATPTLVAPPSGLIRDESYAAFRRVGPGGVYGVPGCANRRRFLLTATNDGLLHAFATDVRSDTRTTDTELWAFIPPAVLPKIGSQYGGAHTLLLDAAPVVKDVAFGLGSDKPWGRTLTDARSGKADWRTVAVGGLTQGGGYYALDVTKPEEPRFLWQITKIDGEPIFGSRSASPAIGTVYFEGAETPVAFLPGGEPQEQPGSVLCPRWKSSSATAEYMQPRSMVHCWKGPSSSLTVVRLWDGKVIRSFRNDPTGVPPLRPAETNSATLKWRSAAPSVVSGVAGYANIDAPLTGAIALYPSSVGAVTTRAFVGDQDGTLWKLDISDPDPAKWNIDMFHDAYYTNPGSSGADTPAAWAPISLLPLISVDALGNLVVIYATGDQSNFSESYINHMFSLREEVGSVASGAALTVKPNWHLRFPRGITTTGPLSLFDGSVYFSTFTPGVDSDSACLKGQGSLWAVDYRTAVDTGTDPLMPAARFKRQSGDASDIAAGNCPDGGEGSYPNRDGRSSFEDWFRCITLPAGSIVFGAGITQRPSCVAVDPVSLGNDPYTNSTSSHSTVNAVTGGEFELVAQTGPRNVQSSSTRTTTNAFVRKLVPPMSVSRIDSWAPVLE